MSDSSDRTILDLLRRRGSLTIEELIRELGITATAVRHRLNKLMGEGLIEKTIERGGRGRPRHVYQASAEAQRTLGQNYGDLAKVLWEVVRADVADPKLRGLLFRAIIERLADHYRAFVPDRGDLDRRMSDLRSLLAVQGVEVEVIAEAVGGSDLPVLRQHSCPYHDLAEADPVICALERKIFEKVLGHGLTLRQSRQGAHRVCEFVPKSEVRGEAGAPAPSSCGSSPTLNEDASLQLHHPADVAEESKRETPPDPTRPQLPRGRSRARSRADSSQVKTSA